MLAGRASLCVHLERWTMFLTSAARLTWVKLGKPYATFNNEKPRYRSVSMGEATI